MKGELKMRNEMEIQQHENLIEKAYNKTKEIIINEIKYIAGNIYGFIKFIVMIPFQIIYWILCHIIRNRYKYITLALAIAYLCHIYGVETVTKGAAYTFMAIILVVIVLNFHLIVSVGLFALMIYGLYHAIARLL